MPALRPPLEEDALNRWRRGAGWPVSWDSEGGKRGGKSGRVSRRKDFASTRKDRRISSSLVALGKGSTREREGLKRGVYSLVSCWGCRSRLSLSKRRSVIQERWNSGD